MTHLANRPPLEQQLLSELQRAETFYRRALAHLQGNSLESGTVEEIAACLSRMEPVMLQIQTQEGTLSPLRKEWGESGRRPGPELKRMLAIHEELLQSLIKRIDAMESQMQQHRRQAIPGLDRVVRHHQMQRAYQQRMR